MPETTDPFAEFSTPAEPAPEKPESGTDPFAEFSTPVEEEASVTKKIGAVGKGALGQLVETGAGVAGAVAGGKVGFAAGLLTGPFAPVAAPVAAGVGAIGGYFAGERAGAEIRKLLARVELPDGNTLTFDDMASVPKHLRPWAVGGETFGGAAPFILAPYAMKPGTFVDKLEFSGGILQRTGQAIRQTPNIAGWVLNRMIDGAAQYPRSFAAAEIAAAASAGIGGGFAEAIVPGSTPARITGEIVGGIANPTRWAISGVRTASWRIRSLMGSFTGETQKDRAAKLVVDILKRSGEDPDEVIRNLKANKEEFSKLGLTAGQMSGSEGLLDLEHTFIKESAAFGHHFQKKAIESLETLKTMIAALEKSGNPQALKAAAEMRQDYFSTLLGARLQTAETATLKAAAEIAPQNPKDLAEFGTKVDEILSESIEQVRNTENKLWGAVQKDLPAATDNLMERYGQLKTERLPEEPFPAIVEGFIKRLVESNQPSNTGELLRFRSRMLALARESAGKGEWDNARVYGSLAESALDDLAAIPEINPALEAARAYSRQLNEVFTQSFAGKAMAVSRTGAERIPPELIMKQAFGPGREISEVRFRELMEAADMAGKEYVSRMAQEQESTLRAIALRTTYRDDMGRVRVDPNKLTKFMEQNAGVLEPFGDLQKNLKTAKSAERFFQRMDARTAKVERIIQDSVIAEVLKVDDPTRAITSALKGANPVTDFEAMIKLARKSGPDAVAGLKSSLYSHAYNQAISKTGDFSFAAYREALNRPLVTNGPSAIALAAKNGVLSSEDVNVLARLLKRAADVENALQGKATLKDIGGVEDFVFDFVNRIQGAAIAGAVPTGGAHGLIVGGAGSRLARQIFDKVPRQNIKNLIMETTKSPEAMAALLEREAAKVGRVKTVLQLNAFLWQAGLTQHEDLED